MTPELLNALLAPVSPEQPSGTDIAYGAECDEIRKLRKGDDPTLSQGEWVREIKTPQWPRVLELCQTILKTQSKDLQVASWHMEALTRLQGFEGLTFSLKVLDGLLVWFWDTCYPAVVEGDLEERIAKLEWLNAQLPGVINDIPMTSPKQGGFSRLRWEESRVVENLGARDSRAKDEAIAEGKLSGEAWDKAVMASGPEYYTSLFDQIRLAQEAFQALELTVDQQFGADSPNLDELKKTLQACSDLAGQMLKWHGVDPHAMVAAQSEAPCVESQTTPSQAPAGAIQSRSDAIRRLREIAKYFRDHEPHSPVGPLAERAARWGEMPLDLWLTKVVKDEGTLKQLRELLDLQSE